MKRATARIATALLIIPFGIACTAASSGSGDAKGGSATGLGGNTAAGGSGTGGSGMGGNTAAGSGTGGNTATGGATTTSGGSGTGGNTATGGAAAGGTGSGGQSSGGVTGTGGAGAGGAAACPTANEDKFSFFLVSNAALMRPENCGPDSTGMYPACGGDFGGLTGADAICQRVAEHASACQSGKVWHAFLSTSTANAIDRIGTGPWYDRNGRLLAQNLTDLVTDRPTGADAAIKNDFPNEDGIPNHKPDGTTLVDNHEVLTGSGPDGKVWTQSATPGFAGSATGCGLDVGATGTAMWSVERATCWDWTRKTAEGCPRVGHPWCSTASCTPAGTGSGTNWMSVWNEGGCLPGGNFNAGGLDGTRTVGSAGGYGGFYCFAVTHP